MEDLYSTLLWRELRARAIARDKGRCTVARLIGGDCSETLHAHHIESAEDRPDLALDLDNVATVCATHHPKWEAIRRAVKRARGWRSCPHPHRTAHGRRECERRLNQGRIREDDLVAA